MLFMKCHDFHISRGVGFGTQEDEATNDFHFLVAYGDSELYIYNADPSDEEKFFRILDLDLFPHTGRWDCLETRTNPLYYSL